MDISKLSKEQLKALIDRILSRGCDYIIRNKKLFVFKLEYGVSVKREA